MILGKRSPMNAALATSLFVFLAAAAAQSTRSLELKTQPKQAHGDLYI